MVNKLVNPIKKLQESETTHEPMIFVTNNIKTYAQAFVNSMDEDKKIRLKKMLDAGINCCESVSKLYKIDHKDFINAVKEII